MDKARKETDKLLNDLERRVDAVYAKDPSLLRMRKKYTQYMDMVDRVTKKDYMAYVKADNEEEQKRLKKIYVNHVKALTSKNKQYKELITEFSIILADVNQKALDLVNEEMSEVYALNYNQVATQCRKAGIEVNG